MTSNAQNNAQHTELQEMRDAAFVMQEILSEAIDLAQTRNEQVDIFNKEGGHRPGDHADDDALEDYNEEIERLETVSDRLGSAMSGTDIDALEDAIEDARSTLTDVGRGLDAGLKNLNP